MKVQLNRTDLTEAISDYIRKKGVRGNVVQVSYLGRDQDWADVAAAVVIFGKEAE
ncbi:hypothetical protein [Bacillus inaquosorum]|uniref:hypothetical protein n=1 Tax=Bacillus inaquosorum TaxID=483913 RepID=UPI00227DDDC7|nr:hypothetical protein [Bacillus inaquosorum]MCY8493740.1 hypothetical protein [Bacillus inaquosorum]